MIQLLLLDNRLHDVQRLLLTAGDFDQKETLIRVLFLPPDQVGSQRRAILSEVEVQPHDPSL